MTTRYKDGEKIISIAKQSGMWKAGYYSNSSRFMLLKQEEMPPCASKKEAQQRLDDFADASGLRVYDPLYEKILSEAGY